MSILKNPPCLYCHQKNTKLFLSVFNKSYFKCLDCQLVFRFSSFLLKETKLLNKLMYGERKKIIDYFKREKYWRKVAKRILNQISLFINQSRRPKILDVGCYCGIFLDEARKLNWLPVGIELEKEAVIFAKKKFNLSIINKDFLKWNSKEKFDVITFIDVFEHFDNLQAILAKTKKFLTANGILFIQCPNIESLVFKLVKDKWNWLLPDVHFYHFSPFSLKKILRENGFEVVSLKTYDDISEFAYNLIDFFGIKKRNFLEKLIWKSLRIIFLALLQVSLVWSYFGYGGVTNLVARKKFKSL